MTEFSKVREMLDCLLVLNANVTAQQFEEAAKDASFVREKLSKFQQRVADKTYSATMVQKVSTMEQDVAKIDAILNNARASADQSRQSELERQQAEEQFRNLCTQVASLCSSEDSTRCTWFSEENKQRVQLSRLAAEDLSVCRKNLTIRVQKEREEMKAKAQIEEERRQRLAAENERLAQIQQEEETRQARERERLLKRRRMENLLQQHRRVAIEDALSSTEHAVEFEFQMVEADSSESVPIETAAPVSSNDVPPPAPDAEAEQRLIDEALELSLLSLAPSSDVQNNKKPEVQGS